MLQDSEMLDTCILWTFNAERIFCLHGRDIKFGKVSFDKTDSQLANFNFRESKSGGQHFCLK